MKITIPNSYIDREFEIKELKVLEKINKPEFYLENKKIFLEKYTDLNADEIELIINDEEYVKQLILYFIKYNDIDGPALFVRTINEFYESLNSFAGVIIFELLNRNYKLDDLITKTKKEIFTLYLFESKLNRIEFPKEENFDNFKKFLIENYNEENATAFLNLINPKVEGNDWNFNKEEYFEKEIESLKNL